MAAQRLSRRLLVGLTATLGLASLAFLVLFIEVYRYRLAEERGNASEQVVRLLQVALENAMLKRDLPGLEDIVRRLGAQPGITGVMIAAPSREVRFASDPELRHTRLALADLGCPTCRTDAVATDIPMSTQLVTLPGGRIVLRSVNPIRNRTECKECHGTAEANPVNGILIVDHDGAGIRREAMKAAAAMSGAGLLVVLAGISSLWLVLRRQVLAPIAALDTASRSLGEGDLSARVPVDERRDDEVVDLSRSFNRMAGMVERSVQDLSAQETFLKALIDTVPDGVRVIDAERNVVLANAALARQTGLGQGDLVGVPCYRLHGRDEPCAPTLVTCPFHAIQEDGTPIRYVHRHVRADGGEVHVETTASRLTLEANGARRPLIIEAVRDLEQQIKYSHEQRLAEIGQLAAGVAHEIYNPLASVRIGLQAVLRDSRDVEALSVEARQYLGMVDGEVQKCIEVTRRLLNLSQVPSSSLQLVSLATIIAEVASLLTYETEQRRVAVRLDLGESGLRVLATDAELRMVTLNLMQNAFHAMPDGGALAVTGREDRDGVAVSFRDSGVGIDPANLAHIFDAFYSRRADGVAGTGLGLTICKAILARYHGSISVESAPGAGSTFTIRLPGADSGTEMP